ncbi:SusD/RagB family nutrient-binding outer membrane lipoprotein [Polaribacter litorisediminis]|uniref:SusD/RagB family nutrient-binding outer membrane lipoprotein n=1 Tax=Polaribacter litorisediminis TaxID=1908341 RepID=UPI001CBAA0FF|nr:SusD/RagB family nutrient-binding outer membrane lipoprotein [Polaribacter litorisediminis]UAM97010.1 SusD/RagB family nutrient-binding outer membrane lipoprotein [Polaribacter litorisediminis]
MKKFIYIIVISTIIMTSCTKDFEDINTNPNAPVSVQPSLLLRQVMYDFGEQMSYEGFVAGDLLAQHRTALDFNLFDRHDLKSPQLGGNPWPIFYTNLRDNEILLKQSRTTTAFAVYEGPALILKAYMAAGLTDLFGDVPYFDAFNGVDGTVTPKYNLQEDIYQNENGILDNLDKGIAAIQKYTGSIPLDGDILYNGNLEAWVKFANSLKIKYLIRISAKVDVANALQTLFNEGNYIQNNAENAVFDFTNSEPNSFRLAQLRVGDFNNFVLSETMEEILIDLNDTRIYKLFRPFANSNSNEFKGLINGINSSTTSIAISDYSLAGTAFREDTSTLDANFMTAWETSFLLAEAAEKGFINTNSETLYTTGVTQAFAYWNTNLPATYLTGNANFNAVGKTPLEQIITQKWIASIINGYEGWVEFRRTGFPALKNVSASLNNELIPVRMPYPAEAASLNQDNYKIAEAATNGNSLDVKVWWNE